MLSYNLHTLNISPTWYHAPILQNDEGLCGLGLVRFLLVPAVRLRDGPLSDSFGHTRIDRMLDLNGGKPIQIGILTSSATWLPGL